MDDDGKLQNLAGNVMKLSKLLTSDRENLPVAYLRDPGLRNAYLRYYLPANMKKVHLALTDLSLHPEWLHAKRSIRVLDIGAGPGTALLGLLAFFAQRTERPAIACVAVDRVAENLKIAEDLFNSYCANKNLNASLRTIRGDIENAGYFKEDPFDLVIFSNVLNELFNFDEDKIAKRISIVHTVMGLNLARDASCIIIEPALRETSRDMLEVRDALVQEGFSVYSPCLVSTKCPARENARDWCHEDIPWDPPQLIKEVDKLTGLRKDSLKFSYLVLRKDSRSLSDMFGPDVFRVVSEPLVTKGKIEFYICGLHGRKLITRLDKDRSPLNVYFEKLSRGAIVSFERLNDEGARFKVGQLTQVSIHKHLK